MSSVPPPRQTPDAPQRPAVGRLARAYAFTVVTLRYPILAGWLAAAALAFFFLPVLTTSGGIGELVPHNSAAARAEHDAVRLFGAPLNAPVAVVQSAPHRLPMTALVKAARSAETVDRAHSSPIPGLLGALPVTNFGKLVPGSRGRATTAITFLYFRPTMPVGAQAIAGETYAHRYLGAPGDRLAGVTGPVPARYQQGLIIRHYLPWVEVTAVVAVALIVGLYFRAFAAPLATLLCAAIAYEISIRVVAWTALRMGVAVPPDLEPVLVVLLLGVTTDYSVFFLSGMRARLAEGSPRVAAARATTAEFAPIILAAGLIVGGATAALVVARMQALRAFGPGLALTVLTAMVVSMTLAPALIAIFGGLLFRPGPRRLRRERLRRDGAARRSAVVRHRLRSARNRSGRIALLATARPAALLLAAACVAGLVGAGWGSHSMHLGSPLIRELPASSQPARASAAADRGFVPGIMSPADVLVIGPGVTRQTAALARLQAAIARRPGVAGVIGPGSVPAVARSLHLAEARSGNAARFAVIGRTDPLGATAVARVNELRGALPSLARSAGLSGVRVEVGGESALTADAIHATGADTARIAVAVAVVILVLLALFLRALLAPLYLLIASVLALAAALGITVWIFQGALGYQGLVYYVPFASGVLLVALGSDYNVFVVGRIWEESRRRPLREAIAVAAPRASRAITTAGLALAASFGLLALIPLLQFRELAVAMAVGVLVDSLVVRSMLVPALVAIFGRAGQWPGGRRLPAVAGSGQEPPGQQGTAADIAVDEGGQRWRAS